MKPTVLVVDDDPALQSACRLALDGSLCQVVTASDLTGALERLEQGGIDLIVLDLSMPEADGLTALRRVWSAGGRTMILIVTSFADRWLVQLQAAAREGIEFDVMRKPLDRSDLRAITATMLSKRSSRVPLQDGIQ